MSVNVVSKPHRAKKSKKNRKHGRGLRKMQRSRFGSYEAWFKKAEERKLQRMETRRARFERRRKARENSGE